MREREFRKELLNLMPGYKWTVHKTRMANRMKATGIQTSGFNRCSTVEVVRIENVRSNVPVWYEVRSAGFGRRAPWLGFNDDRTLARALRGLQSHYEKMACTYRGHAMALHNGRSPEVGGMVREPGEARKPDRASRTVSRPAGAAASEASGAPREAKP